MKSTLSQINRLHGSHLVKRFSAFKSFKTMNISSFLSILDFFDYNDIKIKLYLIENLLKIFKFLLLKLKMRINVTI